ncbi:21318_t:CDS:2, partial [Dentiscutata erythropus]
DIRKYLPWNRAIVSDNISFYDIRDVLRKEYRFEGKLPDSYFFIHTELSKHPKHVNISDLPNNITLPITRKEDIQLLTETLKKKYTFTTNKLSKEWIDLEADTRPPLPTDMNTANRIVNTNLPINRTQILQTVKQLRLHYKFNRLPNDWILTNYTSQDELPSIDKYKESNKGGYGPIYTLSQTSITNHNYNNDDDKDNNIWDSDQDLSLTSLFSKITNNLIKENE